MAKEEKIILYELKTDTFQDSNGSGFGDYNGIATKVKYFQYLNVDGVIFNNILNYYQTSNNLFDIDSKYGSLYDFRKLVGFLKANGIKCGPIVDFAMLKESYNNWKRAQYFYEKKKALETPKPLTNLERYVAYDASNKNQLSQSSDLAKYYEKILSFYSQLGCEYIVLDNIESYFSGQNKEFTSDSILKIKQLYIISKRFNNNLNIILRSRKIDYKQANKIIRLSEPICDYIHVNRLSLNGTDKVYGNKLMHAFKPHKLITEIRHYLKNSQYIVSLASDYTGRINSRWGDELAFSSESSKTFGLLLLAANNSSSIYYGDELGMLKTKISDYHEFNDPDYNESKRYLQSKNIDPDTFYTSYLYQHPISAHSIMCWNDKKNAGYSSNNKIPFLKSERWKSINVESEYNTPDSSLNFYNYLINMRKDEEFFDILKFGKVKASRDVFKKGVFKIQRSYNDKKVLFAINLSNQSRKVYIPKSYQILVSTYSNKTYTKIPQELDPFESLILIK